MGDMRGLIEEHFVRTWTMMGVAAGGELVANDDFQLTLGAIDKPPYNHVQRFTPAGDPDGALDAVVAALRGREALLSITSQSRPDDLGDRLAARGAPRYSLLTGMALDLSSSRLPPPDPRVVEVTPALLDTWIELVIDQWHLDEQDRERLAAMHEEMGYQQVRRWLLFDDDEPVGKVSVGRYEADVAGIYGMGTKPVARGRGVATGLMSSVLSVLREEGIQLVVLQSTPMANALYERVGFQAHCTIAVHAIHGSSAGEALSRT